MPNNILMIINPKAGKQKRKKYIEKTANKFKEKGYNVDIKYTSQEIGAKEIIVNYKDDYNILIIGGGDGTLNQAMQGICEIDKKIEIGFIPVGVTNDFARSLNIRFGKNDLSKNIDKYRVKKIDIGLINQNVFNYVVAFGVFSKASYSTSRTMKRLFGRFAYILSGIKELFSIKTYHLKVTYEEKCIEDDFIYGSVSNSNYIGGFKIFNNNQVKLDDWKFETILVKKPKSFIECLKLILKVINGNLVDKNICYFQSADLKIESDDKISWTIDGEYGGEKNKVDIYNVKQYANYLVPIQ